MFQSVLIANRGAIALRMIRACRALGVRSVVVFSEADAGAPFVRAADAAVALRGRTPRESYLDLAQIMDAARVCGADAIHPGYGFLSEQPALPEACAAAGIAFVGPTAETMRRMGSKTAAKQVAMQCGVPTVPAAMDCADSAAVLRAAASIGFPLLVKAAAGGGGKGMRLVERAADLPAAWESAAREAQAAFGDATVFLEKYVMQPHHVEIQILGDRHGHIVHLGERDCSTQRRHQKIIEESPSPLVDDALRATMGQAALQLARAVQYQNAGTVEFLVDAQRNFYFLEMNTRLQVEHAVTEMVTGVDLVAWQLRIAAGESLTLAQESLVPRGHAIECRLYAEDPLRDFLPATGTVQQVRFPATGVRVESGIAPGMAIGIDYDPMLAKLIVHAPTRPQAIRRMIAALHATEISGVVTNRDFLMALLATPQFVCGRVDTHFVATVVDALAGTVPNAADPFSPWRTAGSGAGWRLGGATANGGEPDSALAAVRRPRSATRRARGPVRGGGLNAPMPGRILKVAVAVGDTVAADDVLVVMEAMKMEYTIKAPAAGTVQQVHCATGDMVELGKQLVEVV